MQTQEWFGVYSELVQEGLAYLLTAYPDTPIALGNMAYNFWGFYKVQGKRLRK